MANLLIDEKYDLIHVHAGIPAFAVKVAQEMANMEIPIIATFHSWSPTRPEWMNIQDAWAFNRCNYVCFDSSAYMEYGKNKGVKTQSQVIYPGLWIDLNRYKKNKTTLRDKIRKMYNLSEDAIIISQLAEVSERKGQMDLVYAMEDIVKVNKNVFLFLVGNDTDYFEYTNRINSEVQRLNLTHNIIMTGWVEDPYEILSASDLFVFPSYNEGLGMAIVEAIALEIPAIFSYIEGTEDIKQILGDECFGTFKPGHPREMSNKIIEYLMTNNDIRLQKVKNAADIISSTFNFNNTVKEYEKLFLSILNKKSI